MVIFFLEDRMSKKSGDDDKWKLLIFLYKKIYTSGITAKADKHKKGVCIVCGNRLFLPATSLK